MPHTLFVVTSHPVAAVRGALQQLGLGGLPSARLFAADTESTALALHGSAGGLGGQIATGGEPSVAASLFTSTVAFWGGFSRATGVLDSSRLLLVGGSSEVRSQARAEGLSVLAAPVTPDYSVDRALLATIGCTRTEVMVGAEGRIHYLRSKLPADVAAFSQEVSSALVLSLREMCAACGSPRALRVLDLGSGLLSMLHAVESAAHSAGWSEVDYHAVESDPALVEASLDALRSRGFARAELDAEGEGLSTASRVVTGRGSSGTALSVRISSADVLTMAEHPPPAQHRFTTGSAATADSRRKCRRPPLPLRFTSRFRLRRSLPAKTDGRPALQTGSWSSGLPSNHLRRRDTSRTSIGRRR